MIINIVGVAFLILCLFSVKYNKNSYYTDNFSKDNTNIMRGIFACAIVFCHLAEMPGVENFFVFRGTGNLGVSMFFFLSGFGLLSSVKHNGINHFVKKRFSSLIIPFILAELISFAGFYFMPAVHGFTKETYTVAGLLQKFILSGTTLIINGWYIYEIILLYFEFYIAFYVFKHNRKNAIRLCIVLNAITAIFFAVLTFYTDWIQFWAYSLMAFPFGVLFAEYKDIIENRFKKHYILNLVVFSIITIVCFFSNRIFDKFDFFYDNNINTTFLSRYLTSPFIIITVILASMKFKSNNKFFTFLGNISYEIYLYHGLIYCILRSGQYAFIENDLIYVLVVFALSLDVAYITNKFSNVIRKQILKTKGENK